jgi:hypothetical protein
LRGSGLLQREVLYELVAHREGFSSHWQLSVGLFKDTSDDSIDLYAYCSFYRVLFVSPFEYTYL